MDSHRRDHMVPGSAPATDRARNWQGSDLCITLGFTVRANYIVVDHDACWAENENRPPSMPISTTTSITQNNAKVRTRA
jgi:hypothetical protein